MQDHGNAPAGATAGADAQQAQPGVEDKAGFDRLVEAEMANLLQSARHEIAYYESVGDFPPGFMTPEELVAEAMIHAWDKWAEKPAGMEPRAWLHAMLFQVADALAARQREIRQHEAVSLEQEIPQAPLVIDPVYDDDEQFYEWYQPDEALKWEDVIGSIELEPDLLAEVIEQQPRRLELKERRCAMLHFRFGFSVEQICRIVQEKPEKVAAMLQHAREQVKAA